MNYSFPKLRTDLTIREQGVSGEKTFIVKDPVTEEFYRFKEAEHFIALQLDGETSPEAVRKSVEARFDAQLSAETLSAFIRKLRDAKLLQSKDAKSRAVGKKRLRGDALFLRYKLFDPAKLFARLSGRISFFYTPLFFVVASCSILLATGVTIANASDYIDDLPRLYQFAAIPLFIIVNLIIVSLHEFGHGLTCTRYGGEVHEVGFLLIYFQPALYCNVSDAWLFPEKSKRLWVGFSGPFFELFLWSLATITWRVTETETWVNYVALIVMTTSGFNTLMNFNPLIKLDGYYLLSDYLSIPNLRKKSFRYIGHLMQNLTGARDTSFTSVARRELRVYFVYGLFATIFSFGFLAYATIQAGGFLFEQNQPLPLAFFLGFVGLRFQDRVQRLFSNTASENEYSTTTPVKKWLRKTLGKPGKGKKNPVRQTIIWLLAALTVEILFVGVADLRVGGTFVVLPTKGSAVRAGVDGIIEEIFVTEGSIVKAGDPIARVSGGEQRVDLQKTQSLLEQAREKLNILENGPTKEEIELAEADVRSANDRFEFEKARTDRSRKLYERDIMSLMEYETATGLETNARNDLSQAQKRLAALERRSRKEDIQSARAEVKSLEVQLAEVKENLELTTIRTNVSGVVATPKRRLDDLLNRSVYKGGLIATVYDTDKLTVEIAVSEKEVADVRVGQDVVFKARAYPDDVFYGTVTSTSPAAMGSLNASEENAVAATAPNVGVTPTTMIITSVIDNSSLHLRAGMTGQAKIMCGERRIIELILRRLARMVKVEFWSWW